MDSVLHMLWVDGSASMYRARALRALHVRVTFKNGHVVAAAEGRHI